MKERGIIMTGESVRAILDGRKTQTRRVMRPQPRLCANATMDRQHHVYRWDGPRGRSAEFWPYSIDHPSLRNVPRRSSIWDRWCPYGAPGDRLWVRETWGVDDVGHGMRYGVEYRADWNDPFDGRGLHSVEPPPGVDLRTMRRGWRSPIHMPRWASRLLLELTEVRVERVQDISAFDARAEGIGHPDGGWGPLQRLGSTDGYRDLWDCINGKRPGCSWAANPWVWVLTFRRLG